MQKKQLSVLVLIILCFLLGCNRETPKDESQQNYEDESNISKTNGEELVLQCISKIIAFKKTLFSNEK